MIDTQKLFAVEWNPQMKQTHIQSLHSTLLSNLKAIHHGEPASGWILIDVVDTAEAANESAELIEKKYR